MSEFPIIFNIDGSSRHELLLISPSTSLSDLASKIESTASNSVNCEEFMAKYAKKENTGKVEQIKVRWATAGRDHKTFPGSTILTNDNIGAALALIEKSGVGKDVLEVKLQAAPPKEEEKKEKALPDRTK
ncbi:uncharacterized protein K452DRAFT_320669 [Aplosporella prunicola CBS 121167]|uniref:Uncharacterized protein n=1 Tax=Aplosporella prunicola CBS 121167 TaxID=1176127 RepID=A0A6A6B5A3_9PEZI|nr:uncharacterized protein K452DRAFT_320669 [Aplosporella prunicola CBS 121167]KAF2139036.1 hypothetical protein K452DRAFT_320669 [Aplosporella prunicola CBS 121167]